MNLTRPWILLLALIGAACSPGPADGGLPASPSVVVGGGLPGSLPPLPWPEAESLFDGETLRGWEGDADFWSVEDGAIVGRTTLDSPAPYTTYLTWRGAELRDFALELEFKLRSGNSGVQFRSRTIGPHILAGYQADLDDHAGWTGACFEQYGRGVLAAPGLAVEWSERGARSEERFATPEEIAAVIRPGEWNRYRIVAVGPRIELSINDVPTSVVVDRHRLKSSLSGELALQLHAGEPMSVAFRDLRLTDLGGQRDDRPRHDPQWIWKSSAPEPLEQTWFRRDFELEGVPQRARLTVSGDDGFEIYLNGELVAGGRGAENLILAEVAAALRPGHNVVAAWVENEGMAAGLFLSLLIRGEGLALGVTSDPTWFVRSDEVSDWNLLEGDTEGWESARSLGPAGTAPFPLPKRQVTEPAISAPGPETITLPEGFRAELVYSVPRGRQGSWVAITFDDRGRLYASDQYGFLYRAVLPPPGDSSPPRVERLGVDLGEAQGLLWAHDALYVTVNQQTRFESGLYRVTDSDGDDRLDRVELLQSFQGHGEHGPHAVLQGPGQELYVLGGFSVEAPGDSREAWGSTFLPEGVLPPRVFYVEGFSDYFAGNNAGWIARTDPEGRSWELYAFGLRNAYDAAFDEDGELFVFDSDMEWELGLPWYRPTRLYHVIAGADFGNRQCSAKWPASFADCMPPLTEVGRASPTGMVSGRDLRYPARWREGFLAGDWQRGRIYSFQTVPHGATYTATQEVFLSGAPLPVTDLAVGPDGWLYFTTGGRQLQSGLYRILYEGDEGVLGEHAVEDPAANVLREQRRRMEALQGRRDPDAVAQARAALASEDPVVRYAARVAIERQDLRGLSLVARGEPLDRADLELFLAVVRAEPGRALEVLDALLGTSWGRYDRAALLVMTRILSHALRAGNPDVGRQAATRELVEAAFPSGYEDVDRQLGVLLAHLDSTRLVPLALERIEAASVQEEAIFWAFLLRDADEGWDLERKRRYFVALQRMEQGFVGGKAALLYFDGMRGGVLARTTEDERRALGAVTERLVQGEPIPAGAREFVQVWQVDDFQGARAELGGRDRSRGRRVFLEASCGTCHELAGSGGASGPALDGLAGRFSPREVLESLFEPSKVLPDHYRETEVWTLNDEHFLGRVVTEDDVQLTLQESGRLERTVTIPKEAIDVRRLHPLSPMPSGLLDSFERDEVLDLLAYLLRPE